MSIYTTESRAGYIVSVAGYTSRGGREHNEDSGAFVKVGNLYYMILADGLGGHGGGDLASFAAVDGLKKRFKEYKGERIPPREALEKWSMEINEYILSLQTPNSPMRTTISLACIDLYNGETVFFHSGDTRIYHFVDGKMKFMSDDHSVSRMAVLSGEITMDEIRFHKDRNKLLRVLGGEGVKPPELNHFNISKSSDQAILICSDGFWEYVEEEEMERTLGEASEVDEWLASMREILESRKKQENDNNSAVILWAKHTYL